VFLAAVLETTLIEILNSSRKEVEAEREEARKAFRLKAMLGMLLCDGDSTSSNVIRARHLQQGIRGNAQFVSALNLSPALNEETG
jgi:hypothetical protein